MRKYARPAPTAAEREKHNSTYRTHTLLNRGYEEWLDDIDRVASAQDIATGIPAPPKTPFEGENRRAHMAFVRELREANKEAERKKIDAVKRMADKAERLDRIEAYKKFAKEAGYSDRHIASVVSGIENGA